MEKQSKFPQIPKLPCTVSARFFNFESDFVESLRCVPMCVRLKLDLAGVKLKLNEWSKMDPAERAYLA
jgi:hypothetical protein